MCLLAIGALNEHPALAALIGFQRHIHPGDSPVDSSEYSLNIPLSNSGNYLNIMGPI